MTFIPTPGVLRVRVKSVWNNISCGNRFFVQYGSGAGGASAADLSAFAAAFESAYHTRFGPFLASNTKLTEVVVEDQTSDTAPSASWSGSVAMTGATADPINSATCAVVSWGLGRRYRGGKPRTYLGPVAGGIENTNNFTATECVTIATAAVNFQTDVGGMGQPTIDLPVLGAVSYTNNKAKRSVGLFEPFTNVRVNQRMGTQRRRLGKLQAYSV